MATTIHRPSEKMHGRTRSHDGRVGRCVGGAVAAGLARHGLQLGSLWVAVGLALRPLTLALALLALLALETLQVPEALLAGRTLLLEALQHAALLLARGRGLVVVWAKYWADAAARVAAPEVGQKAAQRHQP